MEIVCPAYYPGAKRLVEAIPILSNQGVTAIEVGIDYPAYFNQRDPIELEMLVSRLGSWGIRVHSVHSPFGPSCDFSSLDDRVHERGVDGVIDAMEFARVVDAGVVIVHASDARPSDYNRRLDRARGVLRELSTVAQESGAVLAIENLPPQYLGHTPEEIFGLMNGGSSSMGVCFDSGHANLSGRFMDFAEALLPHAVTTHLHDNDGVDDQHRFPGDGSVPWRKFAAAYHRAGCEAAIMLECIPPEQMAWSQAFQRFRATLGE